MMQIGGTQLELRIAEMLLASVTALGFEIVRIKLMDNRRKTLQIMIDHLDGSVITAADCAKVSRQVSALLDVEDPISGEYDLEVSSPGIDRPLVRMKDFERYAGYEVKITLHTAHDGRKNFKGKLGSVAGDVLHIQQDNDEEPTALNLADISVAKLIITDTLIAEAMKQETNN